MGEIILFYNIYTFYFFSPVARISATNSFCIYLIIIWFYIHAKTLGMPGLIRLWKYNKLGLFKYIKVEYIILEKMPEQIVRQEEGLREERQKCRFRQKLHSVAWRQQRNIKQNTFNLIFRCNHTVMLDNPTNKLLVLILFLQFYYFHYFFFSLSYIGTCGPFHLITILSLKCKHI